MPVFSELKSEYATLWASMEIRADKHALVTRIAGKLIRHKARYRAVEARTGVPWFVIAALHHRESDADFSTYLGNGEPLGHMTRLVPKGRGPFARWEEGAVDALALDGLDQVKTWTPERACFAIEKFNGFGYRRHGFPSPYLWSFTNHYLRGKYVADGRFSATHVDQQCGAIPIVRQIMALDETARFKAGSRSGQGLATITAILGGLLGTIAHALGVSSDTTAAILVATVVLAIVAYAYARVRR